MNCILNFSEEQPLKSVWITKFDQIISEAFLCLSAPGTVKGESTDVESNYENAWSTGQ